MFDLDHLPGRSFRNAGKKWLYFSGTAYLGLAHHPAFQQHLHDGLLRYGANFGGSRLSNMRLSIFEAAEQLLAEWLNQEAVLTVSSGSLAGQLLIKYLQEQGDCYFSPSIHPALSGSQPIFKGSLLEWQNFILQEEFSTSKPVYLLSSSMDALKANVIDFNWLKHLDPSRKYYVVIDDSHGLGVLGEDGQGIITQLPSFAHIEYILIGSMGKALGTPGGLIAGSRTLIQALWQSPFFGGASPIIPAYLYAFINSQEIIRSQRKALRFNIANFKHGINSYTGFRHILEHPVFHVDDAQIGPYLQGEEILISAFPYPSEQDPIVSRIVINASHESADIEKLSTLIQRFYKKNGPLSIKKDLD